MTVYTFEDFANQVRQDPERRAKIKRRRQEAAGEAVTYRPAELRKHQHMTQAQLAQVLGIRQHSVSLMEHGFAEDAQAHTLRTFIEGLGATLEIAAVIDGERFVLLLE